MKLRCSARHTVRGLTSGLITNLGPGSRKLNATVTQGLKVRESFHEHHLSSFLLSLLFERLRVQRNHHIKALLCVTQNFWAILQQARSYIKAKLGAQGHCDYLSAWLSIVIGKGTQWFSNSPKQSRCPSPDPGP